MDRRDSKSRRREWLAMLLMAVAVVAAGRAHAEPGAAAHAHPGARTGDGSAAAQASQRKTVEEVLPWQD